MFCKKSDTLWLFERQKFGFSVLNTDTSNLKNSAALKYPYLGLDYVMNCEDFKDRGFYLIGSLSKSVDGNYPENNTGDYKCIALNDNYHFQVLLLFSPRLSHSFYIGYFWNDRFEGWKKVNAE